MNEILRRFGFMVYAPDDGGGSGGSGGSEGNGDGGGEGGNGGDGGGSEGDGDGKSEKDKPKTYTQEQYDRAMNRVGAREHDKGKAAARQEVADELGISLDDVKKLVEAKQAEDDKKLTDDERRDREAAETTRKNEEREARLNRKERDATVRALLVEEGVKFERDEDSGELKGKGARLMKLVTLDLKDDAPESAIVQAIKAVKDDAPELFASTSSEDGDGEDGDGGDGQGGTPPSGHIGGRNRPTQQATENDMDRGAKLAKERNEANKPFDPLAV